MSDRVKLELKDLVLAVTDVTDWYGLGLQLSLPRHMLDTIKAERLSVQESMRETLIKWLDYDSEASWEKLASALEAMGKRAVAENVRRQFARSLTSVAAAVRAQPVDDDKETRLAMIRTVLRKMKSSFSLLLIDVQSSLEDRKVKTKTVRKFLLNFFEGECSIPNVPDMDDVFESVTVSKLWRYDHYGPLEELAESLLPEEDSARVKMAEYISQLSAYYATTSIIDHLQASDQEDPDDDGHPISPKRYNRRYRKLTVKVKVDPSVPMEYVDKLWKSLMKEFNLPPLSAIIDKIEEGSLSITWHLVLPHVMKKIRGTYFKSVDFFQRHNIIEIELYDGLILYDEEWMEGSTPLFRASFAGNIEEVKALLHKGTEDVNQQNDNVAGYTPLIGASLGCGDINIVRLLLKSGAVVDVPSKIVESALMMASSYGHTEVVKFLLEYKADVNLHSDDGATALMMACSFGNTDTVTLLLAHGAIVDHREKEDGTSALMQASSFGNTETVKVLLQHGASLDLTDDDGLTALMAASDYGQADTAKVLLEKGAAVNLKDNYGYTSLSAASNYNYPETVKVLLEFGAEVDLPFDYEDGGTALTVASRDGHTQTVKVLLSHGALVDYQDKNGHTPLHHASFGGHVKTFTVLLERKAKVDLQNKDGWTALFLAAKQGHETLVKTLLDHGAFVNMKSKSGLTALDVARAESHQAVCEIIEQHLNQGAKVEHQQTGGQEDSESEDQAGESGKDSKTELTEEQRSEVRSVSERLWYQLKRVFLREVMEKKERTGQLQGNPSPRITDQPKGRRSILNLFNRPGRRRRTQTQRQVVGTAPVPEHQ